MPKLLTKHESGWYGVYRVIGDKTFNITLLTPYYSRLTELNVKSGFHALIAEGGTTNLLKLPIKNYREANGIANRLLEGAEPEAIAKEYDGEYGLYIPE